MEKKKYSDLEILDMMKEREEEDIFLSTTKQSSS